METTTLILTAMSSGMALGATTLGAMRFVEVCDELVKARLGELMVQAHALTLPTDKLKAWLRLWCVAIVVLPILLYFYGLVLLVPAAIALIYVAPNYVLKFIIDRRRTLLRDQLVPAIQGLANAVQAGLTLPQGLAEVGRETPSPLKQELGRVLADYQRGRPLGDALEEVRQRLSIESFTLFATAIRTAMERGGSINEALARISTSLREHQRIERKMAADTAAGKREVLILSAFPAAFGGMMYLMDPSNARLLVECLAGQCVLLVVLVLVYSGARWAMRILEVQE